MRVYVLLMENGRVHSIWSSAEQLIQTIYATRPTAFDEWTWQVASGELDQWGMANHDSVAYVREAIGVTA